MKILLLFILAISSLTTLAATSEENRTNKKMEYTFQTGWDYKLLTTSLAAMHYLDPNTLVGLKVGANSQDGEKQTHIAAQYKKYQSNSYYFALEAYYLNSFEETNDLWNKQRYATYSSLGIGARLGNQWTWDHFTLGCDWIGAGQRIGRFRKDSEDINDLTLTFMNVIIGASF